MLEVDPPIGRDRRSQERRQQKVGRKIIPSPIYQEVLMRSLMEVVPERRDGVAEDDAPRRTPGTIAQTASGSQMTRATSIDAIATWVSAI